MAVVAIHAVVDIPAYAAMIVVRIRLRVTVRALKHAVVIRIGMTGRAHSIRSAVVHGEVRVIEGRIEPRGGRMAGRTRGWESR